MWSNAHPCDLVVLQLSSDCDRVAKLGSGDRRQDRQSAKAASDDESLLNPQDFSMTRNDHNSEVEAIGML